MPLQGMGHWFKPGTAHQIYRNRSLDLITYYMQDTVLKTGG